MAKKRFGLISLMVLLSIFLFSCSRIGPCPGDVLLESELPEGNYGGHIYHKSGGDFGLGYTFDEISFTDFVRFNIYYGFTLRREIKRDGCDREMLVLFFNDKDSEDPFSFNNEEISMFYLSEKEVLIENYYKIWQNMGNVEDFYKDHKLTVKKHGEEGYDGYYEYIYNEDSTINMELPSQYFTKEEGKVYIVHIIMSPASCKCTEYDPDNLCKFEGVTSTYFYTYFEYEKKENIINITGFNKLTD